MNYLNVKTIKDLKDAIRDLPNDVEVRVGTWAIDDGIQVPDAIYEEYSINNDARSTLFLVF